MNLVFAAGFLVPQRLFGTEYFLGLKDRYPGALFPDVPPAGSVEERAEALAVQISRAFPAGPIHIVAHSMGGLDSRYLLSGNLHGVAGKVACLSTIATPHRGSPMADLLVGPAPSPATPRRMVYEALMETLREMGMEVGALGDLTTGFTAEFNRNHPPSASVRYISYAGRSQYSVLLKGSHAHISQVGTTAEEKWNDGLVSVASARFGEFPEDPWDADHFSEVGHYVLAPHKAPAFDHLAAFDRVVRRAMAAAGGNES